MHVQAGTCKLALWAELRWQYVSITMCISDYSFEVCVH